MARRSFIANFLVNVTSKGVKRSQAELDALATNIDRVAESQANAGRRSRDAFNTMEKGVIGTANGTKSFSKMAETIGGGGRTSLVGVYATLAANVFAVTAAFNALRGAAQVEQVLQGLEASGARLGLTLTVTAGRVRELSKGMLDTEQSLRSTSQFMAGGFKTQELERMTVLARDLSIALGRNMTDSMDRLTRGTLKLEPELLDELGIMTKLGDATAQYADELGKPVSALTQFERRQGFMNAVLAEGELKFGGIADAAGDTGAFDRLGATFKDLTKDIFNMVNVIGKPLASFFASTKVGLLGLGILFASTIRGQLLPMFNDLGKSLQDKANIIRTQSIASIANFGATLEDSHHDAIQWARGVEQGTATTRDFKVAMKEVNREISENITLMKNTPKSGKIDAQAELVSLRAIRREMQDYERQTHRATGGFMMSQGINQAAQGSFKAGWADMKTGFAHLDQGLSSAPKKMELFRNGLTKTASAMRFFGASMLYALPYIGLLIAAGSLLYSWISGKISPAQEKLNKLNKEFGEIIDTVSDKVSAYNKALTSQAVAAARAVQTTRLQANSLNELRGKYEEILEARKELSREEAQKDKVDIRAQVSSDAGVARFGYSQQDVAAFNAAKARGLEELKNTTSATILFGTLDEETAKFARSLERLDKEGWQKQVKSIGAVKIASKSQEERIEILRDISDKMAVSAQRGAEAVQETADAFKIADEAVGQFVISLSQTTPFDDIAKGAFGASIAIEELQLAFERGDVSAQEFAGTISGLGDRFSQLMTVSLSRQLSAFKSADANVQELLNDPTASRDKIQDAQKNRARLASIITQETRKQAQILAEQTAELQRQTRVLDGQLKLEEARRSTVQNIYTLNGKGMLEQFEHEERMRDLQVQRINLQATQLKQILEHNKAKVEELRTEIAIAKQLESILRLQSAISFMAAPNDIIEESERRRRDLELDIQRLEFEERGIRDSLTNLQNEAAAILAQNLSTRQKEARALAKDVELTIEYINKLKEQAGLLAEIKATQSKIFALSRGTSGSLLEQVNVLRRASDVQHQMLRTDKATINLRMEADKNKLIADRAAAKERGQATEAADLAIQNITNQIAGENQLIDTKLRQLELTRDLQTLELVIFDVRKEGIEWQKQGLEYQQKALDVARDLAQTQLKNNQLREQNSILASGRPITEDLRRAQEIDTKRQAYELAVRELRVRETMIDLEYALLEAQRIALVEELHARKEIIMAMSNLTEESPRIKQLTTAITNLAGAGSFKDLAETAKQAIRANVETLRLELEQSSIRNLPDNITTSMNSLRAFDDLRRRIESQEKARLASQITAPTGGSNASITNDNFIPLKDEITKVLDTLNKPLPLVVQSHQHLATIANNTGELVRIASGGAGETPRLQGSLYDRLKQFKEWVEQKYPGVIGNLDDHGGATGNRRGIDFNFGGRSGGQVEWTNEQQKAVFNAIAAAAQRAGLGTLWGPEGGQFNQRRVGGHLDHLHIDGVRDTARATQETATNTASAASNLTAIANAVTNRTPGSVDPLAPLPTPEPLISSEIATSGNIDDITGVSALNDEYGKIADTINDVVAPAHIKFRDVLDHVNAGVQYMLANFKELGPEGEVVAAISQGMVTIGYHIDEAFKTFTRPGAELHEKIVAVAQVLTSVISTVASVTAAASQARIAAIDAEIAAEQRRDGKSAESLAKLQSLERKKDAIAKKQFNTNKKLMMAQAIIATAAGIAQSLSYGGIIGPILAAVVAAMGAAQIAIIAGTSYQSTSAPNIQKASSERLTVGRRGDTVDLAHNNPNAGGEIGYLRGARGRGRNASDYYAIGSAYGGPLPRGYGNTAFAVGEKGPEIIRPDAPVTVRPINENNDMRPLPPINFNIRALDAYGVDEIIRNQRGNIIGMLREAANANGEPFLEDVNVSVYTNPRTSRL